MFASGPCALPDIALLTDAKGAFALAAPMKGSYRLVINAPGFPAVEQDVVVTDRTKSPIEVRVGEDL